MRKYWEIRCRTVSYTHLKIEHPINAGNKKVLIFSAFSDTAEYLFDNVSAFVKQKYGLNTAVTVSYTHLVPRAFNSYIRCWILIF